jgi:hypothetical protein
MAYLYLAPFTMPELPRGNRTNADVYRSDGYVRFSCNATHVL